ncbi:protein unc-50 homolog [Littorina saxatilis]|uniref:Unc-50-like protein n=1 Tax=Littorina saxatilis TaxID=31220 RepID=A0AAN9G7B0_9CAEN
MMRGFGKVSPPVSPTSSTGSATFGDSRNGDSKKSDAKLTANAKRQKYFRRLLKFRQMDFEYAFWQMIYLFYSPQKVYRNFQYRKQTKDQWARDDPAFLVLLSFWLCASSVGFSLVLGLGFVGLIKFLLWVIFVDCIGVGLLIATLLWFVTNKKMLINPPRGQDVEWAYAFDVHLNAFFPLLMILHFFQLPLLNHFIRLDYWMSCMFGNTLWLIAIGYYLYITFLGYSALPFLKNTRMMLFPMMGVMLIYVLSLILGMNFTSHLCNFYAYRVIPYV